MAFMDQPKVQNLDKREQLLIVKLKLNLNLAKSSFNDLRSKELT